MVIKTRKVFEISDEAIQKARDTDYPDDQLNAPRFGMGGFTSDNRPIGGEPKCGGCNWEVGTLYALADNQEEADKLYLAGDAGLCGTCIAELLVEEGLQVM